MDLTIDGGYAEQRRLVENFTTYAMDVLCGKRISRQCTVEINLIERLEQESGYLGFCSWTDEPYRSREFEVEVDANLHPRFLLTTIAHELVHIKQYAKGELRCLVTAPNQRSWYGKRYDISNLTKFQQARLPWEVEARGLEEQIFVEWCEELGIEDDWAYLNIHVD